MVQSYCNEKALEKIVSKDKYLHALRHIRYELRPRQLIVFEIEFFDSLWFSDILVIDFESNAAVAQHLF